MENSDRFPAPSSPSVGIVRDLPHTWEVSALGGAPVKPNNPAAGWQRGAIVRGASPVVTMTTPTPMYDPTDEAQRMANGWAST